MPYYNIIPPVTLHSHAGTILEYVSTQPDSGFRVDPDNLVDRVDISEADAWLFNEVFGGQPLLEETEEEL